MKNPLFAGLIILWVGLAQAQAPPPAPIVADQSRSRPIVMQSAEQWTMRSKAGRIYEISIARPSAAAPEHGYPVMYVLDPSTAFATLVDTVRNQEQMFGPVVVVGVGYASDAEEENRTLDLTPPTDPANLPAGMPGGWGATGGNDAFLSFLIDELKPVIAKAMAVDPSRQALFGHSLGGLFVLHTLFRRSDAFDTYIAGSPSIWWGKRAILGEVAGFKAAQQHTKVHRRLLITVGQLEAIASPEEIRLGAVLKVSDPMKLMHEAKQVANSAELAASLASLSASGLDVHRVAFPDETHNSVIPAYLARGARFALKGWFE
ncbi:MAG TPA: alpha/beta hydrolase-fold protein [Steroidobacteraceae bacterium]